MKDGNMNSLNVFCNLAVGLTIEQIENWAESVQAVTDEQVLEAAREVLGNDPIVTMDLYPLAVHH